WHGRHPPSWLIGSTRTRNRPVNADGEGESGGGHGRVPLPFSPLKLPLSSPADCLKAPAVLS
ncbi:MAG TPA: hypothetical protein PLK31_17225, partial [Chloroflexota bacterium]|nr:hypothetical protein [Chloroflexota bacterium]